MGEWKNYFVYSKRERLAVISLVLLTLGLLAIPHLFEPPLVPVTLGIKEPIVQIPVTIHEDVPAKFSTSKTKGERFITDLKTGERFNFDPNTASQDEFRRLGLSNKAALTVIHYREKGGRFRKPEDLGKVYSIPKSLYGELAPFVRIKGEAWSEAGGRFEKGVTPKKNFVAAPGPRKIDVNESSEADWEQLPGIGSTLARRIVTFRDRLGGFVSVDQVRETYGIADSVFQRVRPRLIYHTAAVKTLDINAASIDDLKRHPYLRGRLAYSIVRYRDQHGSFQSIDDLAKLQGMTDSTRQKIAPYLIIKSP